MNKPAPKEPSMDEILSSIRQIIADDDASVAPSPVRPVPTEVSAPRAEAPSPSPRPTPEPLALSPSQMIPAKPASAADEREAKAEPERPPSVAMDFASVLSEIDEDEPEAEPMEPILKGEPELLDPEDVTFEGDPDPVPPRSPAPQAARPPEPTPPPAETPRPTPRPAASVAQAAPMPDRTLSDDMAEQLLAPATDAAVQGAMARLGGLADTGIGSMTVEAMIREMLRPMLKDWLDENLPALVERMVEKEIARISRGVK